MIMMFKKSSFKNIAGILLFSIVATGCSQRVVYPIDNSTSVDDAQGQYERIPKPVAYTKPPIQEQRNEIYAYTKRTFDDIDNYKAMLANKLKKYRGGSRYGKDILPAQNEKKHKKEPVKLYPKIKTGKKIKHSPLYGIE